MNNMYKNLLEESQQKITSMPWQDREFYGNFLAQTFYFTAQSTRLLARSISHFGIDRDDLYKRFIAHISEENYHERIALSDLKKLNIDTNELEEFTSTKAFYEIQYHKIDKSKGTSVLGYILYLEANAAFLPKTFIEKLTDAHGAGSCKFLKLHAEEDTEHVDDALKLINNLTNAEQKEIWDNFELTHQMYCAMLNECYEKSSYKTLKVA